MSERTSPAPSPNSGLAAITGMLTHRAIAACLNEMDPDLPEGSMAWMRKINAVTETVVGPQPGLMSHRRRVHITVATATGAYLRQWRPGALCVFDGSEVNLETGRIDLMWRHRTVGVFFDEVKTVRAPRMDRESPEVRQAARYAFEGRDRFGSEFAGVRLIPILVPSRAKFVSVEPLVVLPLGGSPLCSGSLGREVAA
jgi:hypothetical protein